MTVQTIKASIIIVGYNGEKHLENCFKSLLKMDFSTDKYEIIYVDNSSTDKSIVIAKKHQKKFRNFKIIELKTNKGFTGGNNIGIGNAQGDIIVFLNQDIIVDRGWLKALVDVLDSNDSIGMAGCKIFYYNSNELFSAAAKMFYGGFSFNYIDREGECDYVSGCALATRRTVLEKIGYFDEDYFMYYEETDLCERARRAGYKIVYVPSAIVWHNVKKRKERASSLLTYYMHRNRVLFCIKNYKHKILFLFLDSNLLFPLNTLYELLRTPSTRKYIKEIIEARKDSLGYCLEELRKVELQ